MPKMDNQERRRSLSEALTIDNAIYLSESSGKGAAIYYMHKKGISEHVATRVLAGPKHRRRYLAVRK